MQVGYICSSDALLGTRCLALFHGVCVCSYITTVCACGCMYGCVTMTMWLDMYRAVCMCVCVWLDVHVTMALCDDYVAA